jgi:hypothetical protein
LLKIPYFLPLSHFPMLLLSLHLYFSHNLPAAGQGKVWDMSTKTIQPHIIAAASSAVAKDPVGVKGEGAIAFGGGAVLSGGMRAELQEVDPEQLVG